MEDRYPKRRREQRSLGHHLGREWAVCTSVVRRRRWRSLGHLRTLMHLELGESENCW
jgi:hypothetical protein